MCQLRIEVGDDEREQGPHDEDADHDTGRGAGAEDVPVSRGARIGRRLRSFRSPWPACSHFEQTRPRGPTWWVDPGGDLFRCPGYHHRPASTHPGPRATLRRHLRRWRRMGVWKANEASTRNPKREWFPGCRRRKRATSPSKHWMKRPGSPGGPDGRVAGPPHDHSPHGSPGPRPPDLAVEPRAPRPPGSSRPSHSRYGQRGPSGPQLQAIGPPASRRLRSTDRNSHE